MNYDGPKQKTDGTWGYTRTNDGHIMGIGYCRPFEEFDPISIGICFAGDMARYEAFIAPCREAAAQGKYHDAGHATAEEACECYKTFLLDFETRFTPDHPDLKLLPPRHRFNECEAPGCNALTNGCAECGSGIAWHFDLCAAHRNRETVAALLTVGESWHS